jgi:hypothetical protein
MPFQDWTDVNVILLAGLTTDPATLLPLLNPKPARVRWQFQPECLILELEAPVRWDDVPIKVAAWGVVDDKGQLLLWNRFPRPAEPGDTVVIGGTL